MKEFLHPTTSDQTRLVPTVFGLDAICTYLLAEDAFLLGGYRLISGRCAPQDWRNIDWSDPSADGVVDSICSNILKELRASGYDLDEPYTCFYQGNAYGYWKEYRPYSELIRLKIARWAKRRKEEAAQAKSMTRR